MQPVKSVRPVAVGHMVVAAGALLLLLGLARTPMMAAVRWVDRTLLQERLMDTLAMWRGEEDWSRPASLRDPQDYRWTAGERPLRIGHALGESGSATANTLGAMQRGLAAGLRLFEVDLVLEAGELICQHDPGLRNAAADGCTLDRLLAALPSDAWLVLDMKTDFEPTGTAALRVAQQAGRVDRIIFQLYAPSQVGQFAAWQASHPTLPGPVLTTYLAHRSLDHILTQAHRLGIRAVTLPTARVPALPEDRRGALVFVHPVHDCAEVPQARIDGQYTLHSLNCSRPASLSARYR